MAENIAEILGSTDPIEVFGRWFEEAKSKAYENSMNEATAMNLCTVNAAGEPSSRIVLLKQMSETGFRFFTSYTSDKASDIASNSSVCLNFYWPQTFKQVKVLGKVAKTSREISETYWNSRPKGSQISQALSNQSKPIASRTELEAKHKKTEAEYADRDLPCPEDWGGYEVTPHKIELWVGQDNRLHDRFAFEKMGEDWSISRLQP